LIGLGCVKRLAAAIDALRVSRRVQVAATDPFLTGMENEWVRRLRQVLDTRLK